jgi:hypothetical protein
LNSSRRPREVRPPQTDTQIIFPNRREGIVKVHTTLRLKEGGGGLALEFRREEGERCYSADPYSPHSAQWARNVLTLLIRQAPTADGPSHRRSVVILRGCYGDPGITYRLKSSRGDLKRLSLLSVEHETFLKALYLELMLCLFPPELFDGLVQTRARGAKHSAQRLLRPVRPALLVAEQIIRRASRDAPLRRSLARILGSDYTLDGPGWRLAAVKLVDRAFSPAWEKYGLTRPADRDASEVYAEYLPPSVRARVEQALAQVSPHDADLLPTWERRLLGPEGQSARDFGL